MPKQDPPKRDSAPPTSPMLVNNLSVADAKHLFLVEGGRLTGREVALQSASALVSAGLTARAIHRGGATAWHLVLPLVGQYFGLLAGIPLAYALRPHPAMRKEALQSVRLWVLFLLIGLATIFVRSRMAATEFRSQGSRDLANIGAWIVGAQMHWPMLMATFGIMSTIPARVRNLHDFGPPFVGAGIGCAMQLLLLFAGLFLLPLVLESPLRFAWALWGLLLAAELLALGVRWDVQRRLKRLGQLPQTPDDRNSNPI